MYLLEERGIRALEVVISNKTGSLALTALRDDLSGTEYLVTLESRSEDIVRVDENKHYMTITVVLQKIISLDPLIKEEVLDEPEKITIEWLFGET